MTATEFNRVAGYEDLLKSMADYLKSLEGDLTPESIEMELLTGEKKLKELSRRASKENRRFFYEQLKANREKLPIVDCLLLTENGKLSTIWTPMDIPPSYRDVFFHSLHHEGLFHLLYRDKQQLFFLDGEREALGEVIGDSEVWTYGPLGNSREDVICSAFVQNAGRFGHLRNTHVLGELNYHQNVAETRRIPGIRINGYPGLDKPVVITPYNQIDMAAAGARTMAEKQGWKRIEADIKKWPDMYKQFVLAAFDAYVTETGYEHPAIFWHLPRDRSR